MADKSLYDMTQDEALEYLRGLEGIQNIGTITQTGGTHEFDPIFYTDAVGKEIRSNEPGEYYRAVSPMFDPNYAGGVYGQYEGIYDKEGNLKDVRFRKGERDEGFFFENLDTIGPLVVGGAMGLGGGLFAGAGGGAGGISPGVMAGLETGLAGGAGAGGISAGTMAGLEAGLPSLIEGGVGTEALLGGTAADTLATGAGISEGTMAGLEAGLPALEGGASAGVGAGISEGTMAGLEAGLAEAGAATAPQLTTLESAKEFLKSLGIKDLKTGLQMGLLGSGLIDYLTRKNASGGGGGGGAQGMQLRTPMTFKRTRNTQAAPTAADARAYLQGQPGTSSAQRSYFNQGFTRGQTYDARTGETYVRDPNTGRLVPQSAIDEASREAGLASGGLAALAAGGGVDGHLGGYSDGGRLLRGPGDGVSDSIPATIGGKQPARLADGEFVVPARIVSELGNGSTEAGARKLYQMMDRIQRGRRKTVGKNAVAKDSRAEKHLPA